MAKGRVFFSFQFSKIIQLGPLFLFFPEVKSFVHWFFWGFFLGVCHFCRAFGLVNYCFGRERSVSGLKEQVRAEEESMYIRKLYCYGFFQTFYGRIDRQIVQEDLLSPLVAAIDQ